MQSSTGLFMDNAVIRMASDGETKMIYTGPTVNARQTPTPEQAARKRAKNKQARKARRNNR